MSNELREAVAAMIHDQWCGWMRYLFGCGDMLSGGMCLLPAESVDRWQRQMRTEYAELPEEERESDREPADELLALLRRHGVDV